MHLTPQEAAAALAEAERARATMRQAVRAHRGHVHLWIWGGIWSAMALLAHFRGDAASIHFPWLTGLGAIASVVTGFAQSRQIKAPVNWRLIAAVAAILGFAVTIPIVIRARLDARIVFAYIGLVTAQCYVVTGLWADNYLSWAGLLLAALILLGVFVFPAVFWLWMAVFAGGSLIATGFYVRNFWR